ncbi:hypothetical protein SY85_20485 [Flavisolibacter tropicus]|uniref:Uncharacterized protein n=1 Tax=Flavisolibacter tropicus TaxID=1492898 RepID=A0A172TZH4_9BACT|nr:hypothetical protein SY85_20485 [Flavisolibacter tropicus]
MLLNTLIVLAFTCGFIGIVFYVLHGVYRMKEDTRRENLYKSISDYALLLLCILGVIIMLYYAQYSD